MQTRAAQSRGGATTYSDAILGPGAKRLQNQYALAGAHNLIQADFRQGHSGTFYGPRHSHFRSNIFQPSSSKDALCSKTPAFQITGSTKRALDYDAVDEEWAVRDFALIRSQRQGDGSLATETHTVRPLSSIHEAYTDYLVEQLQLFREHQWTPHIEARHHVQFCRTNQLMKRVMFDTVEPEQPAPTLRQWLATRVAALTDANWAEFLEDVRAIVFQLLWTLHQLSSKYIVHNNLTLDAVRVHEVNHGTRELDAFYLLDNETHSRRGVDNTLVYFRVPRNVVAVIDSFDFAYSQGGALRPAALPARAQRQLVGPGQAAPVTVYGLQPQRPVHAGDTDFQLGLNERLIDYAFTGQNPCRDDGQCNVFFPQTDLNRLLFDLVTAFPDDKNDKSRLFQLAQFLWQSTNHTAPSVPQSKAEFLATICQVNAVDSQHGPTCTGPRSDSMQADNYNLNDLLRTNPYFEPLRREHVAPDMVHASLQADDAFIEMPLPLHALVPVRDLATSPFDVATVAYWFTYKSAVDDGRTWLPVMHMYQHKVWVTMGLYGRPMTAPPKAAASAATPTLRPPVEITNDNAALRTALYGSDASTPELDAATCATHLSSLFPFLGPMQQEAEVAFGAIILPAYETSVLWSACVEAVQRNILELAAQFSGPDVTPAMLLQDLRNAYGNIGTDAAAEAVPRIATQAPAVLSMLSDTEVRAICRALAGLYLSGTMVHVDHASINTEAPYKTAQHVLTDGQLAEDEPVRLVSPIVYACSNVLLKPYVLARGK
jgi:hypothetical protein